jgi:hypothetical protein
MSSSDQLKIHFSQLRSEEILTQLVDEQLTEEATAVALEELSTRGVHVESALEKLRGSRSSAENQRLALQRRRIDILRRIVQFPARSSIGLESPWLVLAVGIVAMYSLFKLLVVVVSALLLQRPLPEYALPTSYAALVVFYASSLWFSISLWRCAPRSKPAPVVWLMRAICVFLVFWMLLSAWNVVPAMQQGAING